MRAASWRPTAKPKGHQDASGRASRHEGTDSAPYLLRFSAGEISCVRAREKSAEAVLAEKPRNGGGAKGRRTKYKELEKRLENRRKKRTRITGATTTVATRERWRKMRCSRWEPPSARRCRCSANLSTESECTRR